METTADYNKTKMMYSFEPELKFTETYLKNKDSHKAIRELECLRVQLPYMLLPIEKNDLVAGRIRYNTIGFHHIIYGDGTSDFNDRSGYCYDKGRVDEKLIKMNADINLKKSVGEICAFWENENSNFKARKAFNDEMAKIAPTDNWTCESAVVHPLYRIAEIQPDHGKLVALGIPGLKKEIRRGISRTEKYGGDKEFYIALDGALDLVIYAIDYYIDDIDAQLIKTNPEPDRKLQLEMMKESLENIKGSKPKNFREAFQLIWIFNITAGIADFNRMDVVLGDFYAADIDNWIITEQEAVRVLLSAWRIIDEIYKRNSRVILGGQGRLNEENADRFALAAMEATRLHKGLYPQTSLRYYEGMNPVLMDKALDILGDGWTFPVLYNDDINVLGVEKAFGVSRETAQDYSFFGCGEFILGHRSIGTPNVIINLAKVLEITMRNGRDAFTGEIVGLQLGNFRDFITFEELFDAYNKQLTYFVELSAKIQEQIYKTLNESATFLLQSLLLSDCLAKGKGMLDGGLQHLGGTTETYGNITTADSLTAIKYVVYDKKIFNQDKLLTILDHNYEGFEEERRILLNVSKYGNDDEQADSIAVRVHEHVCNLVKEQKNNTMLDSFLVVEINNSANTCLGKYVSATPDGRLSRDILSNGNGPVQGMDRNGITALINSLTKMRCDIHAGISQNLKFSKSLFNEQREQIENIIYTYFELGGSQANVSVVNKEDLLRALVEPEKYQHLIVRVGGISVRFVELPRDVQEDMIRRTTY